VSTANFEIERKERNGTKQYETKDEEEGKIKSKLG
jgi:hypothetical protein